MNNRNNLSYIVGVFMIILGIIFILSPSGVFQTIVLAAGIIILIFSILGFIAGYKNQNSMYALGTSVLGFIFGLILITNTNSAIKIIPIILGTWLLLTGISTFIIMKDSKMDITSMANPITKIILGAVCLFTPIIPIVITGIFIGIILILAGISQITNTKSEEVVYKVKVKK